MRSLYSNSVGDLFCKSVVAYVLHVGADIGACLLRVDEGNDGRPDSREVIKRYKVGVFFKGSALSRVGRRDTRSRLAAAAGPSCI